MQHIIDPTEYAKQIGVQLKKGFLSYCVLKLCANHAVYTSDIIKQLQQADLVVVEGTIYPLLSRLQKDGLLQHTWQESEQGPPRKYYIATQLGQQVVELVKLDIESLNRTLKKI